MTRASGEGNELELTSVVLLKRVRHTFLNSAKYFRQR